MPRKFTQLTVFLDIRTKRPVTTDSADDYEQYFVSSVADIVGVSLDADGIERRYIIGNAHFILVRLAEAHFDGCHAFFLLDSKEELEEALPLLNADANEFIPAVSELLDDGALAFPKDLLLIQRIVLHPCARGKGLSGAVIRNISDIYEGRNTLVVLRPFPLQASKDILTQTHRMQFRLDALSTDEALSKSKLTKLYGSFGFKAVAGCDLMIAEPSVQSLKVKALKPYLKIAVAELPAGEVVTGKTLRGTS